MTKSQWLAVYKQYGATAIGSVLGVPAATVRRWAGSGKSAGLPKSREREIETLIAIRRHEGYEEKSLREMMKLAQKAGKLPRVKNYSKRRDGEKTTGFEVSQSGGGMLNEATLLQLRNHFASASLAKGLPNWLASVTVSAFMDEAERAGSADVRYQVDHDDANNFVVESIVSSGLASSRKEAIESVVSKLRQKMNDSDSRFYLHGSYITTYEYKTPSESYELTKRRKAKRK